MISSPLVLFAECFFSSASSSPRSPPLSCSSERKCIASVLRRSCRDEHDHHSVIHSNRTNSSRIRSSSCRIQVKPSRASPLNLSKIELLLRSHHPVNQDVLEDKFYVSVSFSDASVVRLNNEPIDKGRRPRDDCQTVHFTSSINLTNSRRQSRKKRRNATLLSLSLSLLLLLTIKNSRGLIADHLNQDSNRIN